MLRRLATNLVDVLTPDGTYLRAFADGAGTAVARVRQADPETLDVTIDGPLHRHAAVLARVQRVLGTDVDLAPFYQSAASLSWLNPLVVRMQGVKPPRYPTLWEACVNAIVYQQVSLGAASAIKGRITVALGTPLEREGVRLYAFPTGESFLRTPDAPLRAAGLSAGKLATLRRAAEALESGELTEAALEERSTPDAAALLCTIKGIGPWTATVILLRGLGRLDLFPANDSGVARNLAMIGGSAPLDVPAVLDTLGPYRGMLYYHLLLARLEAAGALDGAARGAARQATGPVPG